MNLTAIAHNDSELDNKLANELKRADAIPKFMKSKLPSEKLNSIREQIVDYMLNDVKINKPADSNNELVNLASQAISGPLSTFTKNANIYLDMIKAIETNDGMTLYILLNQAPSSLQFPEFAQHLEFNDYFALINKPNSQLTEQQRNQLKNLVQKDSDNLIFSLIQKKVKSKLAESTTPEPTNNGGSTSNQGGANTTPTTPTETEHRDQTTKKNSKIWILLVAVGGAITVFAAWFIFFIFKKRKNKKDAK
ncbi:hypothetical protein [Mycoplasmopsis glycophila]|uniref:Uncharacterized protein n=1 Tax=Mycoplasmopsis glycophila TaxID=171285 RepID=A0A449AUQ8_9BACT|nr:hypothetical protein [Mycoplasmopsis glycophila]VEU70264.1 Uncharacterised protein [Mycoplasmopsis glycophila]